MSHSFLVKLSAEFTIANLSALFSVMYHIKWSCSVRKVTKKIFNNIVSPNENFVNLFQLVSILFSQNFISYIYLLNINTTLEHQLNIVLCHLKHKMLVFFALTNIVTVDCSFNILNVLISNLFQNGFYLSDDYNPNFC